MMVEGMMVNEVSYVAIVMVVIIAMLKEMTMTKDNGEE